MAEMKELAYDGKKCVVEVARRDINGKAIPDTYVNKAGDTMTGPLQIDEIDNTSGNAMVRYKSTESNTPIVFGSSNRPVVLMGSKSRPSYSKLGSDFAGTYLPLYEDLIHRGSKENPIQNRLYNIFLKDEFLMEGAAAESDMTTIYANIYAFIPVGVSIKEEIRDPICNNSETIDLTLGLTYATNVYDYKTLEKTSRALILNAHYHLRNAEESTITYLDLDTNTIHTGLITVSYFINRQILSYWPVYNYYTESPE